MKILIGTLMSLFLYAGIARSEERQQDLDLDALAAVALMQDAELQSEIISGEHPRGVIDTIEAIKKNLEGLRDSFLATFDLNKNGRIDAGEETENLKKTVNDVILLLVDTNQNGAIEPQEITALVQQIAGQLKTQIEERVCTGVITEAKKWGKAIDFNPLLKAAYDKCTSLDSPN